MNSFENKVKLANSTVNERSCISQPETPRKHRSLTAKKHPSLQNRHSVKTQLLARFENEVKLANSTVDEQSLISQAETLTRRSLKAKRPRLQNCHSVKTQRPLCSFKVLGSMSHHEEMESERPSTKRSRISQVEAPSSSSSCSIGDVRSTLPISTNSVKHSASQDEDESLLLGLSLLPADSDEESLKYSDSEDEPDSEDESDSDFYFSDIPDDYGYSDDVVFDYNDVVIAPTAPPSLPITRTERVKSKRQSRLQRELESSLDGVKWSSGTALLSLPITGTERVQRKRQSGEASYARRWVSTELESSLDGSYWAMWPICPFSPFLEQQGKYLLVI